MSQGATFSRPPPLVIIATSGQLSPIRSARRAHHRLRGFRRRRSATLLQLLRKGRVRARELQLHDGADRQPPPCHGGQRRPPPRRNAAAGGGGGTAPPPTALAPLGGELRQSLLVERDDLHVDLALAERQVAAGDEVEVCPPPQRRREVGDEQRGVGCVLVVPEGLQPILEAALGTSQRPPCRRRPRPRSLAIML
eukprot:COSAG01_NODE_199_length_22202_cov_23.993668_18_plen_195_part_00